MSDLTKMKLISTNFDRSFSKLRDLVNNPVPTNEQSVQSDSISKLSEAIQRVDQEIKSLKNVLQENGTISDLKMKIQSILQRREVQEVNEADDTPDIEQHLHVSTPLKTSILEPFEDFPNSPTIEQLGLSGPTLSIVGRRAGFDSSASISDGEFDNSFYQKSPMNANDNSFSSDVSVPNFRILNSSPQVAGPSASSNRPQKSNLKQMTTMIDFSNSEDSSMIMTEGQPSKKVHFAPPIEDSENYKMNN